MAWHGMGCGAGRLPASQSVSACEACAKQACSRFLLIVRRCHAIAVAACPLYVRWSRTTNDCDACCRCAGLTHRICLHTGCAQGRDLVHQRLWCVRAMQSCVRDLRVDLAPGQAAREGRSPGLYRACPFRCASTMCYSVPPPRRSGEGEEQPYTVALGIQGRTIPYPSDREHCTGPPVPARWHF